MHWFAQVCAEQNEHAAAQVWTGLLKCVLSTLLLKVRTKCDKVLKSVHKCAHQFNRDIIANMHSQLHEHTRGPHGQHHQSTK